VCRVTFPPLRQLVLKIHSRCDLACDHCYVYEHADQSWSARPKVISEETLGQVTHRFAAYAKDRELTSVSVILHGGEPLLVGPARLQHICAELTRVLSPVTSLDLRIHTNGVRLNRHHLEIFDDFGVKVGISLDGDRAANDRHRLDRKGRSSYDRVLRAVDLLRTPEFRHLYLGLLCTVDLANDPVAVHDALAALDPPAIDYLLPHSTWDSPPPRPPGVPTPYADWLLRAFDRWEQQGRTVAVRTFDSVLSTLRGGPSLTEAFGLAPSELAVVETDGSFEQADSLKTAYHGAAATGFDVFRHGFGDVAGHPGVLARQLGLDGVSDTCRGCRVVDSCGGGLYAHRYSSERAFDNPSVFCPDLRDFIDGVAERVTRRALTPAVYDPGELRFSQTEMDRALLALLHERHTGEPGWSEVWRGLVRLDTDENAAPHLNALVAHPYVRASLRRCADGAVDTARLAAVVAAAAVRAGAAGTTLGWENNSGSLHLPALGTVWLPGPGRVEVTATVDGFRVRDADHGTDVVCVRLDDGQCSARWRPLAAFADGEGPPVLIDDADPGRDCFPVAAAPMLEPSELRLFQKRCRAAYELLNARVPRWWQNPAVLTPTTVTPLVIGSGVRLGSPGIGALGVAVDVEPEELAPGLLRASREARLAALREVTDLHPPHSAAGRLLDEASAWIGGSAYRVHEAGGGAGPPTDPLGRVARALTELAALPQRELTESGAVLAGQLWTEWARHHV
jgi:uncharacterized protein